MLAKNGWKIISSPNSISALLLKSKYLSNENFMEAKKGTISNLLLTTLMAFHNSLYLILLIGVCDHGLQRERVCVQEFFHSRGCG